MRRQGVVLVVATSVGMVMLILAASGVAQQAASEGPYKVLKTAKVSGDGGFDCVYANDAGRRLYIPRTEQTGARITVLDLDTLAPGGAIANASARGAAVDPESGHGVGSSKPGVVWGEKALVTSKAMDVGC